MRKIKLFISLLFVLCISIGQVWGAAAVGSVIWSETWTGSTTGTSGSNTTKASANYGNGTTVYNNGTVTYSESANTVYIRNEKLAGGDAPELMLSSNQTWTISGIPTGGATELTLTYLSNNTKSSVALANIDKASITGSSKSYTITTGGDETINLVFSCTGNTRIDNISLTVKTAGSENTCDKSITISRSEDALPSGCSFEISKTKGCGDGEGESVDVTATPASHYTFTGVTCKNSSSVKVGDIGAISSNKCTISGITEDVTIGATFTEDAKVTAKFYVDGTELEDERRELYSGSALGTLPTATSTDPEYTEFIGWTEAAEITAATSTSPTLISATTTISEDKNYRAVFGKLKNTYSIISGASDLTTANYVFLATNSSVNYAMGNTVNSSTIAGTSVTLVDGKVSNPAAALVWKVTPTVSGSVTSATLYNANANKYLVVSSSSNALSLNATATNHTVTTVSNGAGNPVNWIFANGSKQLEFYSSSNKYQGYTSQSVKIYLYKQDAEYLTKFSNDPQISVSESSLSGFEAIATAGAGAAKSFKVSGVKLQDNISVSVTGNYEICQTVEGEYTNSLTLTKGGDNKVAETTIFVRLKAHAEAAATVNGSISVTSTGAEPKSVTLAGTVVAKVLNSIAIKTAPTKTTYILGETFDPAGLVITRTYNSGAEELAYAGHESEFSFSPDLTTAITGSHNNIQITWGDKSVGQKINKQVSITWMVNNTALSGAAIENVSTLIDYNSKIANIPASLADQNGKKFVGWYEGDAITTPTNTKPTLLGEKELTANNLTENKTYLAVFATVAGSKSYELTISAADLSGLSGYVACNGLHEDNSVDASDKTKTIDVAWTTSDVCTNSSNLQVKSGGYIKNTNSYGKITKIEVSGAELSVYAGTSEVTTVSGLTAISKKSNTTPNTYVFSGSNGYFYAKNTSGSLISNISSIKVYHDVVDYNQYATTLLPKAGQPTGTTESNISANSVDLSWTAAANASGYEVKVYDDLDMTHEVASAAPSENSVQITGLTPCTDYYYTVRAKGNNTTHVDGDEASDFFTTISAKTITVSLSEVVDDKDNAYKTGAASVLDCKNDVAMMYTATDGHNLPATIAVTINGETATVGVGYTWVVEDAIGTLTIPNAKITGDITVSIVGQNAAVPHNVTFVLDGGTGYETMTGKYADSDIDVSVAPTKDYYDFTGWTVTDNVVTITDGHFSMPAQEVELTANWTPTPYNIAYTLNGGTNGANPETYNVETATFSLADASRDYYQFDGWYDNSLFEGEAITSIIVGSNGNKQFYAKWTPLSYEVTYNNVEGATNTNPANFTIESADIVLADASKDGANFGGWYDNAEFTGKAVTTIANGSHGNKQLWAKWTHTVTFQNFGVTVDAYTREVVDGTAIGTLPGKGEMTACMHYQESNTFLGWSYASTGKTQTAPAMIGKDEIINEDKTLNAVWAEVSGVAGYKLVNELTSGKTYIFVSSKDAGAAKALDAKNMGTSATSTSAAADVTITEVGGDIVVGPYNTDLEFYRNSDSPNPNLEIVCSTSSPIENLLINGDGIGKKNSGYKSFWNNDKGLYGTNSRNTTNYYVYYDETASVFKATSGATARVYAYERQEASYSNYMTTCEAPTVCDAPEIAAAKESFVGSMDVTITCGTVGATIYYTLDGSDPATSDTKIAYNGAITLTETKTVKAIAMKDGLDNSTVATKTYTKATISSLTIATQPTKKTYNSGEDFDATGLKVNATYSNEDVVENYAAYTIEGTTALATGTTELTIKSTENEEVTATISGIKVNAKLTWMVSGTEFATTNAAADKVVLPAEDPTNWACNDRYPYFRGWVEEAIDGVADAEPTYVKATDEATADKTYYAVFAAGTVGEPTNASSVLTVGGVSEPQNNPYVASDGAKWSWDKVTFGNSNPGFAASSSAWIEVELPIDAVEATSISIDKGTQTWAGAAQVKLSGAADITTLSSTTLSYDFTATNKTDGTYKIANVSSTTKGAWIKDVTINYIKQTTTYTEWITTCCEQLPAPEHLEVASITKNRAAISWTAVENATGYEYKIGAGDWTDNSMNTSVALSDLAAGTEYTVSVRATDNTGTHCAAGAAANVTFTTNYTISIAEGIANGSISAATEAAAGTWVEVTVAPATNYGLYQFTVNGNPTGLVEGKFQMPAENVTLGAEFRNENQHTITFMKNNVNATGEMAVQDFEHPNAVTLTANAFELAAAKFKGWATSSTGEKVYDNGATVTDFTNENQVLYAVWEIAYDHYYDRVHGHEFEAQTGVYTRPNLSNEDAPAAEATDCAETHYIFKGWVAEASKDAPTDADLIAGGVTGVTASGTNYYAVWAEKKNVTKSVTATVSDDFTSASDVKLNNVGIGKRGAFDIADITYEAVKDDGTAAPAISNSNLLRLYKPAQNKTNGSKLTITATNGYTIKKFTMNTTSDATFYYASGSSFFKPEKGDGETVATATLSNLSCTSIVLNHRSGDSRDIKAMSVVCEKTELADVDYITECVERYELNFNNNGGTGESFESVKVKKDGTFTLPTPTTLNKDLNDFTGWNTTTTTGDGTHYDAGDTYTMGEEDVTLYAEWTPWKLESLTLNTASVKKTFDEGEKFSAEGLKVSANYKGVVSGTNVEANVEGWTTNLDENDGHVFTHAEDGTQTVTVTYNGVTADYDVTVTTYPNIVFRVNGVQVDTKVSKDGKMVFPAVPTITTTDNDFTYFVGWTKDEYTGIAAPAMAKVGDAVNDGDIYHAVFGKVEVESTEEKKLTITRGSFPETLGAGYAWFGWNEDVVSGEADVYANNSAIQMNGENGSKTGALYSTSIMPGDIKSIKMTKASGNSSERSWNVYGSNAPFDKAATGGTQIGNAQTVTTSGATWTVDADKSYRYFMCKVAKATEIASIEITYDNPIYAAYSTKVARIGEKYTRDVTTTTIGTICLPQAVDANMFVGATFYEMAYKDNASNAQVTKVFFDEVDHLEAGKPYIFVPTEGAENVVCYMHGDEVTAKNVNGLIGVLGSTQQISNASDNAYRYYAIYQGQVKRCAVAPSYNSVPDKRAYIDMDDVPTEGGAQAPVAGRKRISLGNISYVPGTATGIDGAEIGESAQKVMIDNKIFILRGDKMYSIDGKLVK